VAQAILVVHLLEKVFDAPALAVETDDGRGFHLVGRDVGHIGVAGACGDGYATRSDMRRGKASEDTMGASDVQSSG